MKSVNVFSYSKKKQTSNWAVIKSDAAYICKNILNIVSINKCCQFFLHFGFVQHT